MLAFENAIDISKIRQNDKLHNNGISDVI